ncbi:MULTISPECIES: bifunctional phosphoribosyl-AMP cyclohydrolase/phosphoribosyl-ATP diphosphatase HisIE [Bacillus amyloliquefaciens group]|uniref:bifunctional phosphoribosyl-AMP cyclohydrolase/phosphoribosyl-ATP diphosphatase HisIE n=1 Tax=Bacillus amyloliquefaciens group TaxID=1938374 RepID=UPI00077D7D65|nr:MULTISPECIES: bifunctional phosphoribosyl-AMP cyclohydrolase/phosphoribosyl-ATP diphosphatase HisIE [Bacillus amyloliquefaciens group]AMQ71892.1 phosphoribosyl-ATP pyrophosphatase [Bacillus amyloliquefaciens UMAF6614]AWM49428.1 bifunctional phosphoribosyl-AMP cyclohydrolase/phosphoribosyl-ATP diphosphatase HisIE [Bacillus amyloliquefaciens]MBF6666985.1 bifunctional phosphoribosyl-AMP cyclohydrolase/phosphoribosyl-ATP diphosphatase HisIE [Bacillus velezensis]MCE4939790.1 bifunctional phosphor
MKRADELRFDEAGLIPAIVQDAASKEVLTLAYMNRESYEKTIETKETWFYSRSRQELWHKGATSGNTQKVKAIRYDCDQDALVVLAEPSGPACHKGSYSCFSPEKADAQGRFGILNELESVIAKRQAEMPDGAYTTYLFREGVDKILKKVGEEAAEVIIAAKNRDHEELKWEAADLLYHLLVLLREQSLPLDDVLDVLAKRHSASE